MFQRCKINVKITITIYNILNKIRMIIAITIIQHNNNLDHQTNFCYHDFLLVIVDIFIEILKILKYSSNPNKFYQKSSIKRKKEKSLES